MVTMTTIKANVTYGPLTAEYVLDPGTPQVSLTIKLFGKTIHQATLNPGNADVSFSTSDAFLRTSISVHANFFIRKVCYSGNISVRTLKKWKVFWLRKNFSGVLVSW